MVESGSSIDNFLKIVIFQNSRKNIRNEISHHIGNPESAAEILYITLVALIEKDVMILRKEHKLSRGV